MSGPEAQWSFLVGEPTNMRGGRCILIPCAEIMEALCLGHSQTFPYVSLYLAALSCIHHDKTNCKSSAFLNSVSYSSQLSNVRGVLETPKL